MKFNSMMLVCLVLLTGGAYTSRAQVGVPQPNGPANKTPVPNKLPPGPQPLPAWKYEFARSPVSALNTINGATNNQTIRDPHISAAITGGQPVFHIFYHPKYNAATPWKWKLKQIAKLNEVVDFLSYKNASKAEPLHTQAKVVMASVSGQNMFYIFYVTNDEAKSFNKPQWEAFFTNTADNVLAGVNQSGVGKNGIPLFDFQVSATDKGFYYFFNPQHEGPGSWGWARAETPEGALKYLNTKYTNKPVDYACIAVVQEPTQTVFYIFYR
ncbi:MAG: hypothetical protein LC785_16165 [Acidobacteria bacterium]|nr:hypothetical protein [Acidobacteriota bacterium]MCA1643439.1 hypothetical protein [Acidobacteriota bacterium]